MQETTWRVAGVEQTFTEHASGGCWERPALHRVLDQFRPGDVVVVWKLDRLSRSLKDRLHLMEQIEQAGAGFRSLTEAMDTTTPAGRMLMQMVGSFAELERAMIHERTQAGHAAATTCVEGRTHPAYRPRAASGWQGAYAEDHAQASDLTDTDQASRASHEVLFHNDDHACSGDWALHQSL